MSVEATAQDISAEKDCVNLETVNRISKLPIVESTIETATTIYSKVKDYNSVTNWTLSTAESTVHKVVEIGKPIAAPAVCLLKEPIQKVDDLLCTGLDYIEEKIPGVKLPPGEMYNGAKDYVTYTVGTGVETAKSTAEAAKQRVEPVVKTAKQIVEPVVKNAKNIIDPVVEKAYAMKDYGSHKVDGIQDTYNDVKDSVECEDCFKKENSEELLPAM